ncbi:ARM repeat protein interacting with ABF2 [Vitis vinifera]|uniref:ARM repeat protein interacting with ABF2 n=1 Tax=Vitis vinifera TaxID=29760 RepID=A0A438F6A1_VITVI|nr:ARM repeat protein interacting with ABF2 [Vitis vinifera]
MILLLDAGMVLWALLDGQSIGPLKEMPAVVRMRAMPVLTCAKFPIQGYTGKKASIGSCDDKQFLLQVYLGEQYVNSATLSDVTFLVGGKRFYAHRICLLASSDAFRAMFDGGYREKDARDIEIPNIRWEVFELMMRFIYTGSVEITLDIAQDLLRAADQYLLEGLKRLCEYTIAQFSKLSSRPGHSHLIQRIIPEIRTYFAKALTKPNPHNSRL